MQKLNRWFYKGGRPNGIARVLNRISALQWAKGIGPEDWITLEVPGRKSGEPIQFPLVVARANGERYILSMLGEDVNWVKNLRAAGLRATVLRRGRHAVAFEEVPVQDRAPIIAAYVKVAPGGRSHIPVPVGAPLAEFAAVAHAYPVFRFVNA